jgi:hypothetical protein
MHADPVGLYRNPIGEDVGKRPPSLSNPSMRMPAMLALRTRHERALNGAPHKEGAEPTCEQRDNALIIGRSFKTVTTKTLDRVALLTVSLKHV